LICSRTTRFALPEGLVMYLGDRANRGRRVASGASKERETFDGSQLSSSDEFAQCIAHLQDPMELAIFAKLRADKVADSTEAPDHWAFKAESVFHTLQWAHYQQIAAHQPKNKLLVSLLEFANEYKIPISVCILVLVFVVISAAVAVTQQLTQQVAPHSSGVLVATSWTAASGRPVAMGTAVEFHSITDFPALPATTLRRLEQVAFWHQEAYHWYRVASVVRLGNAVSVTAEEGTVLRIDGPTVYVHRPCCGEQLLDRNTTRATETGGSPGYGRFSVLSQVPEAKE